MACVGDDLSNVSGQQTCAGDLTFDSVLKLLIMRASLRGLGYTCIRLYWAVPDEHSLYMRNTDLP